MSYSKLFGSLIHSSVWQEPDHIRIVWITMLAMKDRDGIVASSLPGLAKAAGKTVDETIDALRVLSSPDPYSTTPDHEGRRIEVTEGGWRVLNHDIYRDRDGAADARKKGRERVARHREKQKLDNLDHRGKICTYVIVQEGTGYMKIGMTASLRGRLAELQTGSPTRLHIAYAVADNIEAQLHEAFTHYRVTGEWFRHSPEILAQVVAKIDALVSKRVTRYSALHLTSDPDPDLRNREPLSSGSGSGSSQLPDLGGAADLGRPAQPPERVAGPVARPHTAPLVVADPGVRARQGLVDRFRDAIGRARAEVSIRHGLIGVRVEIPLHGGENETELRQRLRDAGDRAADDLEHVIAVAKAEALASKNGEGIRWLGWNLGRSRSWDRALASTPELATKKADESVFDVLDQASADLKAGKKII